MYYDITRMDLVLNVSALGQAEPRTGRGEGKQPGAVHGAERGSRLQPLTYSVRLEPRFPFLVTSSFSPFPTRALARVALHIFVLGGR